MRKLSPDEKKTAKFWMLVQLVIFVIGILLDFVLGWHDLATVFLFFFLLLTLCLVFWIVRCQSSSKGDG